MQLLRAVREEIYIIRVSTDEFREVQAYAPSDVTCKSLIVETIAVIRDVTKASFKSYRAVVLEELWLNSKASSKLAAIYPVAHIAKHHIVRVCHLVNSEFVEESSSAGLRYAVRERAGVDSRSGYNTCMGRVLPEKFIVPVLHVEVLVLGNGLVIWDDSSTYWYVQIAGTWKPTATMA
jgi:hypothetical protein